MRRIRFVILIVLIIITLFVLSSRSNFVFKEEIDAAYNSNNLLRLHVVANSNSLKDQEIKREIRNEIIIKTEKLFDDLESSFQAKAVINDNLAYVKQIIESKLKETGVDYNVNLEIGEFYFPTRSYGGVTLAEGDYNALRVVLGAGNGANWWCVLFPPLCFIDSMDKLSDEEGKRLVSDSNFKESDGIPIEFRFKFIEILKEHPKLVKSKLIFQILDTSFPNINKLLFMGDSN